MRSITMIVAAALVLSGCGDTDVPNRGGELAPGEEIEDRGLERDVEPVEMDTLRWFRDGRTVEFNGRTWIIAGEPVWDPAVEHVGEFEGTPLYAEVAVTPPYRGLYIPLGDDYWQRLEPSSAPPAPTPEDTGVAEIR